MGSSRYVKKKILQKHLYYLSKKKYIKMPQIGVHETTYGTGQIHGGRVKFILFAQPALAACDNPLCNLHIIILYNSHTTQTIQK